jgi:allantoicase
MTASSTFVDLAAERVGGVVMAANDEFFAPKENLLKEGRGVFREDEYTERGKWMDGWETRRRREPGHDWCLIKLGIPGVIRAVTIDTNHFRGNYPEACSLEACEASGEADAAALETLGSWAGLLQESSLEGHAENRFGVISTERATHVRLHIYPDGGVARLRVWGEARPDWSALMSSGQAVDLVAIAHGGRSVSSSDRFFSEPSNLIMPGRSHVMNDGWETRRRRGPGHDWATLALGHRGLVDRLVVDTGQFKGNYPESCSVQGCDHPDATDDEIAAVEDWFEVVPRSPLSADREHSFAVSSALPMTHVRLNIFPDGGVSRLRVFGLPAGEGQ